MKIPNSVVQDKYTMMYRKLFTDQVALAKNQVEITKQRIASQLKPMAASPMNWNAPPPGVTST